MSSQRAHAQSDAGAPAHHPRRRHTAHRQVAAEQKLPAATTPVLMPEITPEEHLAVQRQIAERAHALFHSRTKRTQLDDWIQAETEVLAVFLHARFVQLRRYLRPESRSYSPPRPRPSVPEPN